MRITKEPRERRQEILDTAMKLFYQNGYEKTSIGDIAKEMNVAQGLCYRYFPSKEVLFDTAIDEYAGTLVLRMTDAIKKPGLTLKQIVLQMSTFQDIENDNSFVYKLCHSEQSRKIHNQLSMAVCSKMVPVVKKLLDEAIKRKEAALTDTETAASFCVYGQLGILLQMDLSSEERQQRIQNFLIELLNKF